MKEKKPPRELPDLPATWTTTKQHHGRLLMAGVGPADARIAFVTLSPDPLEMSVEVSASHIPGKYIREAPCHLKGTSGKLFKEVLRTSGLSADSVYFTSLVKYDTEGKKPDAQDRKHSWPLLVTELSALPLSLIVACDKEVFDMLTGVNIAAKELKGGWLWSDQFQLPVCLMPSPRALRDQPEKVGPALADVDEIIRMDKLRGGRRVQNIPLNYRLIQTESDLIKLVEMLERNDCRIISADAEWEGNTHMSGRLRSIQLCWAVGQAVCIRFLDELGNYVLECSYERAGQILGRWLNRPEVMYVGHHIAADLPWMHMWLRLDWYRKVFMDTQFALQTIDEHVPGSLERLSISGTDLGAYSIPLTVWRKRHKVSEDAGFGGIPDRLIVPYSCRDVDVPFRVVPLLLEKLQEQDLLQYYFEILHPMVTDVFVNFALLGLPCDRARMDELRDIYHYVKFHMREKFLEKIQDDAFGMLSVFLTEHKEDPFLDVSATIEAFRGGDCDVAEEEAMLATERTHRPRLAQLCRHARNSLSFNISSTLQMREWLFGAKNYTPIKTTGKPAMSWEKVLELPPERRSELQPAVDKQTLQILGEQHGDPVLKILLEYNAVCNIVKMFLPEKKVVGPKSKAVVREKGLRHWLADDGRIHNQYSTTETGRPRAWKPNILNWTSGTNKLIAAAVLRVLVELFERGELEERFHKYIGRNKKGEWEHRLPSLRSFVRAPEGYCFTESDFKTAEIRALGFQAGDQALIDLMTVPDTNFFCLKGGGVVRAAFPLGYTPKPEDFDLLMSRVEGGNVLERNVDLERIERNPDGSLKSPPHDLHWSLSELEREWLREYLAKHDRDSAKVGNFSSSYGATPETLERKIEADTGIKPLPGTGQRLLDALSVRQPVAQGYLEDVEQAPIYPGYLRAASGRVRHFLSPAAWLGGAGKLVRNFMSSQGREARNFGPQESVGATLSRSLAWLLDYYISRGMRSRPGIGLYDAVCTLGPIEERFLVKEAHELMMVQRNTWLYHGVAMNYPIDTDFVMAWSEDLEKQSPEAARLLNDPTFRSDPWWVAMPKAA